jgi:hypothetical protein
MPAFPPRAGLVAACLSSADATSSVIDVRQLLDLSGERIWMELSVPLAHRTPVFIRLSLPGGAEHVAAGEVVWSVRDPGSPGHFTAVQFTPPLAAGVLRLLVDVPDVPPDVPSAPSCLPAPPA